MFFSFGLESIPIETVTIVVQEKHFQCNKTALVRNSKYFEVMFGGCFAEQKQDIIELKDVNKQGFTFLLKLSNIDKNYDPPISIVHYFVTAETANMLQFIDILKIALDKIIQFMNTENVFKILEFAEKNDFIELISRARCFAFTEFNDVKKTYAFLNLSIEAVYKYLSDINLRCDSELDVFKSIIDWFDYQNDPEICTEASLFLLLTCLDFNSLSIENVIKIREHYTIQQYKEIPTILNCIINNEYTHNDKAKQLKNSKNRNRDCFLGLLNYNSDNLKITWYNDKMKRNEISVTGTVKHWYNIKYKQYTFGYKYYICWFDDYIKSGNDTYIYKSLWMYDTITKRLQQRLPKMFRMSRNWGRPLVCGNVLYLVCKTGEELGHSIEMVYYDLEKHEWTNSSYHFDITDTYLIFCNPRFFTHNNTLFTTCLDCNGTLHVSYFNGNGWDFLFQKEKIVYNSKEYGILVYSDNKTIYILDLSTSVLRSFEIKNDLIMQRTKETEVDLKDFVVTPMIYSYGSFYRLDDDFDKKQALHKLTAIDPTSFEEQTIDIFNDKGVVMFNFRHYSVCEKQKFVNNFANDILQRYIENI